MKTRPMDTNAREDEAPSVCQYPIEVLEAVLLILKAQQQSRD